MDTVLVAPKEPDMKSGQTLVEFGVPIPMLHRLKNAAQRRNCSEALLLRVALAEFLDSRPDSAEDSGV